MTKAQLAYEADVSRRPTYHDGTPRKAWSELGPVEQWSWGRDPKCSACSPKPPAPVRGMGLESYLKGARQ